MPRASLTAKLVDSLLRHPPARQVDYLDAKVAGFGLRVSPGGTGSWFVRYRFFGEHRRDPLGRADEVDLAEARELARDVLRLARRREDPRGAIGEDVTVGELVPLFLAWIRGEDGRRPPKRTADEDERILERDVLPAWRDRPLASIRRRDVRLLLARIVHRGAPVMANRTQATISSLFAFALDEELVATNPAARLARLVRETPSGAALPDRELGAIWRALDRHPRPGPRARNQATDAAIALRVLLLTGCRRDEVLDGSLDELDDGELEETGSWWTIPGARTKKGRDHRVFLTAAAVRELRRLDPARELAAGRRFVVTLGDGTERKTAGRRLFFPNLETGRPLSGVRRAYAGLVDEDGRELTPPRPRELRRTFATGLARLRIPREVREACLGHAPEDVIGQHYDRYTYADEKRAAWEAWSAEVERLAAPEELAEVVPISR